MIRVDALDNGRVTALVLNRPDRRNALTPGGLSQLADAAHAAADTSRALLLAGEGRVFCAGFDLTLCRQSPDGAVMRELLRALSHVVQTLRNLPIPVVVAAHGAAIAGGCALLGGADVVVTDMHAKLGYPVLPLGVSPAVSAPFLMPAVGSGPARGLMLNPALITGSDAYEMGLAHELVQEPGDVAARAQQIASELADKPAVGLAATKRLLNRLDRTDSDEIAREALGVSLALTGGDEERRLLPAGWARRST
ncbi:MAG: enoyl-CoA hydratase/isomerase family protein [Planctomycetes bacterium]|nr:enoyl-CoA hydratase/isomerase family protein [Planctomycetota bacterium]